MSAKPCIGQSEGNFSYSSGSPGEIVRVVRIYSQEMVTRRLIPLVVAFAVAFAPVALEACQASCLSHATMDIAVGGAHHHHGGPAAPAKVATSGHSHHHAVPPAPQSSGSTAMKGGPHFCDHGDDLPASAGALQTNVATPDVAVATFEIPQPAARPLRGFNVARPIPSTPTALSTQLRV